MWIFENFYNSDNFCRNGNQMHFREQTADHMYSVRYCSAGLNHRNTNASARIEYKQLTMFTGVYNFVQLGPNLAPHILYRVAGMFILSWLRSLTFKQTN